MQDMDLKCRTLQDMQDIVDTMLFSGVQISRQSRQSRNVYVYVRNLVRNYVRNLYIEPGR